MNSKTKFTATNEEAKSALVPKLRFPEFRGTAAWKRKQLGDLFSERQESGMTDLPLLSLMDKEGIVPQEESNRKNNSSSDKTSYLRVVPGDIAYNTMRMWEGRSALVGLEGLVSPAYTVCRPKHDVHSLFFSCYFKTPQLIAQFRRFSQGLVKDTLNLKFPAFAQISAAVPTYLEQKRIAECLSSVDELLTAHARKVDALKTHKKGLMQQLFPREGETQPRLRFSTQEDWDVDDLRNVAFFQEGPGIMAVDFRAEGIPLVRLAGVSGPVVTLDGCNYLDPAKVARKWARFRLGLNDLLISTSATFGLSSLVTEVAAGAVFYTGLIRFRPSNERLDRGFLKAYLASPHFERQVEIAAVGGGIKHFGPTHLNQMDIPIPPPVEQKRIAECLSDIDAVITAETHKLEALEAHKKGLMQLLFPSREEVES